MKVIDAAAAAGIDQAAFEAWFAAQRIDFEPPLRLEPIGQGKSNITLAVGDGSDRAWIARRAPLGATLDSAHDVRREARVLAGVAASAVPAPPPVALCEQKSVCAAPLLLMERIGGVAIDGESVARGLPERVRASIGAAMAGALVAVHGVDLEAGGLLDLSSHGHYGRRQLRRWSRQWELSATREVPAVEEVAAALEANLPDQVETTLVHGDFHLLNCLIEPITGAVTAVLDWELCTLGDPLADLGTMLAYWSAEGGHPLGDPFGVTAMPGFCGPAELAAAYGEASGRDLEALAFWQALAYWKVAIIAEGVDQRHRQDPANPAGPGGMAVDRLLDRASRTLEEGVRA